MKYELDNSLAIKINLAREVIELQMQHRNNNNADV